MTLQQSPRQTPAMLTVHPEAGAGCLKATGEDALDLLNRLSTNRVDHLRPGHWAPTVLTSDRGRIVDLLSVIHAADCIYILTSPGQQQNVVEWLDKYTIMEDLEVEDISASTCIVALAGSGANLALGLETESGERLPGMQYPAPTLNIGGQEAIAISRSMGSLPCWLLAASSRAVREITGALADSGAVEADSAEWDALRVASGVPAFGSEMGEPYNPLEAGLIGAIDFTKGCYIGQEVIARIDSYQRVQKYLSTLRFADGSEAAEGAEMHHEGRPSGMVTSIYRAPGGELRGLGFVRAAVAIPGQALELRAPASGAAVVVDTPKLFGPGQDFS